MKYKFTITPANFLQHKPIVLNPGDISCLKLGRGDLTKIKDNRLSREHIEINFKFDTGKAELTVIGGSNSTVNSNVLKPGESASIEDGTEFELLEGKYRYKLSIKPLDESELAKQGSTLQSSKRKLSSSPGAEATSQKKEKKSDDDKQGLTSVGAMGKHSTISALLNGRRILANSTWDSIDDGKLLIYTSEGATPSSKIAAFDLDGTLITPASGKRFPTDTNDWKILYPEIPKKLKNLVSDGFKIVIVTNQAGIASGSVKVGDFKKKIQNILSKFNIPAQAFVSTGKTAFRKPSPKIWKIIAHELNDNVPVNMHESFFCGDAAGREDKWAPGKKKDHSIADRLFALNVGLNFYTPEEYFLGERKAKHKFPEFDPKSVPNELELIDPPSANVTSSTQEVVIMVGAPGSGKSHFAQTHMVSKGYKWINRDTLKDWKKCVSELDKAIKAGLSAVVDNTSPDKAARAKYVDAVARRCPVRCFVMNTTISHSKHNVKFREFTDSTHSSVPDVVIYTYRKNFVEPTLAEGFSEIVKVNFVPNFSDPSLEEEYRHYLLEH